MQQLREGNALQTAWILFRNTKKMRVNPHVYAGLGICRAVRYELWKTHGGHRQSVALFFPPTVGCDKSSFENIGFELSRINVKPMENWWISLPAHIFAFACPWLPPDGPWVASGLLLAFLGMLPGPLRPASWATASFKHHWNYVRKINVFSLKAILT